MNKIDFFRTNLREFGMLIGATIPYITSTAILVMVLCKGINEDWLVVAVLMVFVTLLGTLSTFLMISKQLKWIKYLWKIQKGEK